MLPGKNGISLTTDQLSIFILALPELTAALAEKGLTIPRPNYNGSGGEPEHEAKRNFDATSDEDE